MHVVAVLEDRPVAGYVAGVVVSPTALRAHARRPDPLVEDDVVDVQPGRLGDEVRRHCPALPSALGVDRTHEDVDGPAVVVRRAPPMPRLDAARREATEREVAEGPVQIAPDPLRPRGQPASTGG